MPNDAEKQQATEAFMSSLAEALDQLLTDHFGRLGFALFVFEFNRPGVGNYVSNAERKDMISMLRETADRLENKEDIPPGITLA